MNEFIWSQAYRPKTVAEVILPERLKKTFQFFVDSGRIPNLMLSGPPGVGKTTIALATCEEMDISYLLINASSERGIDTLRNKVSNYAATMAFDGKPKVIILDEADALTPEAQDALKGIIEEFSQNCSFVFTCNRKAKLIEALHSRTSLVEFKLASSEKPGMAAKFYERIKGILEDQKVDYEDGILIKLIEKFFPDFRRTINEIQFLAASGPLDKTVLHKITDVRGLKELMGFLKDKDFSSMRKWVSQNSDNDASVLYRKVYDSLYEYLVPDTIPQAVLVISKYLYQSAFVADQEICVTACLTELMVECQFK